MSNSGCVRFYRGRSMRGTFRTGDYLHIVPVHISSICAGDIVVYRRLNEYGEERELTHRVIAASPGLLITRGDNNPSIDTAIVTTDNLVGRVTHIERYGKEHRIYGAYLGLVRAKLLHIQITLKRLIRFMFGKVYFLLRESGIVSHVWRPVIKKIYFKTNNGPLVKYICGRRTIANWWPELGFFECYKPYDLVIRYHNSSDNFIKNVAHVLPSEGDFSLIDPLDVQK